MTIETEITAKPQKGFRGYVPPEEKCPQDLAQKCFDVARNLGQDRGSYIGIYNINHTYLFSGNALRIDCDIGRNSQGDGQLYVEFANRTVFLVSSSEPVKSDEHLQEVLINSAEKGYPGRSYKVAVYNPSFGGRGNWEERIKNLLLTKRK